MIEFIQWRNIWLKTKFVHASSLVIKVIITSLFLLFAVKGFAQTSQIETLKKTIKDKEIELNRLKVELTSLKNEYAVSLIKSENQKTGGLLKVAVNGSAQLKTSPSLLSDNILEVPGQDSLLLIQKYPQEFWKVLYQDKVFYVHEHWIKKSEQFQYVNAQQVQRDTKSPTRTTTQKRRNYDNTNLSSICGAPTKTTKRPCQRLVRGGGRCFQHS